MKEVSGKRTQQDSDAGRNGMLSLKNIYYTIMNMQEDL